MVGVVVGMCCLYQLAICYLKDGRFDHNSEVSESNAAEVGPFVAHVIMANADKPAPLAAEPML